MPCCWTWRFSSSPSGPWSMPASYRSSLPTSPVTAFWKASASHPAELKPRCTRSRKATSAWSAPPRLPWAACSPTSCSRKASCRFAMSGCHTASARRPAPLAAPAGDCIVFISSLKSRCSRSPRQRPQARCMPSCWESKSESSRHSTYPTACLTSAPEIWVARPTASSILKRGCRGVARPANTAR